MLPSHQFTQNLRAKNPQDKWYSQEEQRDPEVERELANPACRLRPRVKSTHVPGEVRVYQVHQWH